MVNFSRTGIALFVAALTTAGCVTDRPRTSDSKGPNIIVTFSGGAEYQIESTDSRPLPRDQCAIVRGAIKGRNVDVRVVITDPSGMDEARIVTEGNGIRPGSARLGSVERDIRLTPSTDDPFRDQIEVRFLPLGADVRTGAVVFFNIESTFQAGVELTVYARDSFGNTTNLAPFNLVSTLQTQCANG